MIALCEVTPAEASERIRQCLSAIMLVAEEKSDPILAISVRQIESNLKVLEAAADKERAA